MLLAQQKLYMYCLIHLLFKSVMGGKDKKHASIYCLL